jgi:S-adenosylmethionine:tRNA ribosyltransferase-isomerase
VNNFWPPEYADLNFDLPEAQIATEPVTPADDARLMVIDREAGSIRHTRFRELNQILASGDILFYNATRVEARRIALQRPGLDKIFECVFLKKIDSTDREESWQVLMRGIRRIDNGSELVAVKNGGHRFVLTRDTDRILLTTTTPITDVVFTQLGEMPLPPYMRRLAAAADAINYQNFFQQQISEREKIAGSAAAPTAALHFTTQLYEAIISQGVQFHPVCLDIGYGTFAPLTEANFQAQRLHAEHYFIPEASLKKLQQSDDRRRIALGTTTLRAIAGALASGIAEGETDIFIQPGDAIPAISGLITNFHLPQSSLLLLTAAFCGRKLLAQAYHEAIKEGYRFYSYGDAMLIL